MSRTVTLALGLAAALAISGAQAQTNAKGPSKADQKFVIEAIQGDLAEIKMGELAQQSGATDAVKQYGQMLVADHSAHLAKAKSLAQSMNMMPPAAPSAKQTSAYDKVSKLKGAAFDKAFTRDAVRDHRKDISEFQKEAKKSGEVGDFAKETLPTLQKHLQAAQRIQQQAQTTGSK
jgi:putative membrane protein